VNRYWALIAFMLMNGVFSLSKAQDKVVTIPAIKIQTPDGLPVNTSTFSNNGKPMVIDFWATWCKPCIMELDAVADKYDYWQRETGVKIILVSVDSATAQSHKVANFVKNKGWRYSVYLDPAGDFQKAMQVMDTPCTFVVDGNGKIVWMHSSYMEGDEDKIFAALKELDTKHK